MLEHENGGFGSAVYNAYGPNTDKIYYGILSGSNPLGGTTYGSPSYTHDEGLFGVLVHEFGHMTAGGQTDHDNEYGYWNQEKNHGDFITSDYFRNGENYAWNFSRAVTTAMYGSAQEAPFFARLGDTPWQLPIQLFHTRNPGQPIRPFGSSGGELTQDRFQW